MDWGGGQTCVGFYFLLIVYYLLCLFICVYVHMLCCFILSEMEGSSMRMAPENNAGIQTTESHITKINEIYV